MTPYKIEATNPAPSWLSDEKISSKNLKAAVPFTKTVEPKSWTSQINEMMELAIPPMSLR